MTNKSKQQKEANLNLSQYFIDGDPFTNLLIRKWRVNIWIASALIVLLLNIPVLIMAFAFNYWQDQGELVGLLNDYAWWFLQLTGVAGTFITFLWMPGGIKNSLNGLKQNKVIKLRKKDNEKYINFLQSFNHTYTLPIWGITSFVLTALFMVVAVIPEQKLFTTWINTNQFTFWYYEFFWFIIFSLGLLIVLRAIIVIYWLNKLFRDFTIDVKILHPDKAGGLSPLGEFSVFVGYVIGIYGLAVVAVLWSHQTYLFPISQDKLQSLPAIVLLVILYLILAPVVFFAPIGSAHKAMKNAKNQILFRVAEQYEKDFTKIENNLDTETDQLNKSLAKLDQLHKIHKMASSFPIWPFNTSSIVRFFSSTLSPLIIVLIPTIIDLFIN